MQTIHSRLFLLMLMIGGGITIPVACKSTGAGGGPTEATIGDDFERTAEGEMPGGWTAMETHGKGTPGVWRVVARPDAPTGRRVLSLLEAKNTGATFNLCVFKTMLSANVTVAVQLQAGGGKEDQGGGLLWRLKDENNYYLARWNPLENNIRAYRVEDGARRMLASAELSADAAAWHSFEVVVKEKYCIVYFDRRQVLEFTDDAAPSAGKAGLWTKADATTLFDHFSVTTALAEPAPAPTKN